MILKSSCEIKVGLMRIWEINPVKIRLCSGKQIVWAEDMDIIGIVKFQVN